jgi:hypothetical protein
MWPFIKNTTVPLSSDGYCFGCCFNKTNFGFPSQYKNHHTVCGVLFDLCANLLMIFYQEHTVYTEHTVAQLAKALRYKPEGHGSNSRCCHWNFSLT